MARAGKTAVVEGTASLDSAGAAARVDPGAGVVARELSSVRFAAIARRLSESARGSGIEAPGFRSPPRSPGLRRSIRRERDGSSTVSVALRGRPGVAVIADMVDGVVAAASLTGVEAAAARDSLWSAAAGLLDAEVEAQGSHPGRVAA